MVFDDDELTEEKVAERTKDVIDCIDEIERLYKKLSQLRTKRDAIPRTRRPGISGAIAGRWPATVF